MRCLKVPRVPCPSCPWRVDQDAAAIPNFDLELAEDLADSCPDERGQGPGYGAPVFACHQSKPVQEVYCAGWLMAVGSAHPMIRLAVLQGKLEPEALRPVPGIKLHTSFRQVIEKLRATTPGSVHRARSGVVNRTRPGDRRPTSP